MSKGEGKGGGATLTALLVDNVSSGSLPKITFLCGITSIEMKIYENVINHLLLTPFKTFFAVKARQYGKIEKNQFKETTFKENIIRKNLFSTYTAM